MLASHMAVGAPPPSPPPPGPPPSAPPPPAAPPPIGPPPAAAPAAARPFDPKVTTYVLGGSALAILIGIFTRSWMTGRGGSGGVGPLGVEFCSGRGICRDVGWKGVAGDIEFVGYLTLLGGLAAAGAAAYMAFLVFTNTPNRFPKFKLINGVFGVAAFATTFFAIRLLIEFSKQASISYSPIFAIGGVITAGVFLRKLRPYWPGEGFAPWPVATRAPAMGAPPFGAPGMPPPGGPPMSGPHMPPPGAPPMGAPPMGGPPQMPPPGAPPIGAPPFGGPQGPMSGRPAMSAGAPPMGAPHMQPPGSSPMPHMPPTGAPPMGAPPMSGGPAMSAGAPPMGAPPTSGRPAMSAGAPPMGAPPQMPPPGAPPIGAPHMQPPGSSPMPHMAPGGASGAPNKATMIGGPASQHAPPTSQSGPGAAGSRFCGRCGKPMTFVAQYQRWFCPQCQQYT
jgi:hypothetical protein